MDNKTLQQLSEYAKSHRRKKRWQSVVTVMAAIVVFVTTYALILPAITWDTAPTCGFEAHTHTDDCYIVSDGEKVLSCGLVEHTHHDIACYTDPKADVETKEMWEATLNDIEFTGQWNRDVLLVARSQINYCESSTNYKYGDDGVLYGYTRYGDWFGDPYGKWSAMFVSFCMNYAGVEGMPFDSDSIGLMQTLSSERYDLYRDADTHTPYVGELVFLDKDKDGTVEMVGIVAEIIPEIENESAKIKVIEGDSSNKVQYVIYEYSSDSIIGYGMLPEGDYKNQTLNATLFTDGTYGRILTSDDTVITVSGMLPKGGRVYSYPVFDHGDEDTVCAYDITVFDGDGNIFQPFEGDELSVSIQSEKLKEEAFIDGTHAEVYYMPSEGEPERISTKYTEQGVEFSTDHFSVYAVKTVSVTSVSELSDLQNAVNNNRPYIKLTASFNVTSTISVGWGKTITLDLNGKTLKAGSNTVFNVQNGGSLTILDSTQPTETVTTVNTAGPSYGNDATLSVSGNNATLTYYVTLSDLVDRSTGKTAETLKKHTITTSGAIVGSSQPIITVDGGTFKFESGMLRSGTNRAIYQNYSNGTTVISGGYICGFNRSYNSDRHNYDDFGGAVLAQSGTLTIKGNAVLAANRGSCGGAVGVVSNVTFNINGGTISGNVSVFNSPNVDHSGGGGICAAGNAVINMTDGYITNNTADGQLYLDGGGGIFIRDNSVFTINGGYITGNKAQGGGGIKTGSGNSNTFTMNGGFFSGNLATVGEGAGICIERGTMGYVNGGYITNNILENTVHWGGGGLFCADASTVYVKNLLVVDNSAGGFGGGISGCPTGNLYLYVDNGCAVFDNKDIVNDDGIHYVSGGTKDGIDTIRCNELFQKCGHADYFCAMKSTVTGTMLGGGSANWHGSADYEEISAGKGDLVIASEIMGLQAHPDEEGKQNALASAKVYMNGNYSYTHGGAIMCNGILIIGEPVDITASSKVQFKANKVFYEGGTTEELSLVDNKFNFELIEAYLNGTVLENAKCDDDGSISFEKRITLNENGTYTYYIREVPDTSDNTIIYDNTIYRIVLTVQLDDGVPHIDDTKKYTYRIVKTVVDKTTDGGETWINRFTSSSPQDESVIIDLSRGKTFVNRTVSFAKITAKKEWQGEVGASQVTVILKQNGVEYDRKTLNESNNWTYVWDDLPIGYRYTVEELPILGYEVSYSIVVNETETVQRQLGNGTWWVPAKEIKMGGQYLIVSPDGKKALCVTSKNMDNPFTVEDTTNVNMQSGQLTLNGVQYDVWMPYDSSIPNGAIFTPQNRNDNSGIALKSGIGDSWLLAQFKDNSYLKGTTGIAYSSMVVFENGMLKCNDNFDNTITKLRPVVYANGKFDSVDIEAPLNAVTFLTLASGNPVVTETFIKDAVVTIVNSGSPVYQLPETGGDGTFMYIAGGVALLALGVFLTYRRIKGGREDSASF